MRTSPDAGSTESTVPGDRFESPRNQLLGFQMRSVFVLVAQRAHRVAGLQIGKRTGLGIGELTESGA